MCDLIVLNARVWTGDPRRPEAEAVATCGDRIVEVGTSVDLAARRQRRTRVIDAHGAFLVPGFHDAHVHLMLGGVQLTSVDLKNAASPEEFARRIAERARSAAPGEWILGGSWDEQHWPSRSLPTRALVDEVAGDTPVFVRRYDVHMSLANTAALRRAGVTAATPDPPGGLIVRDERGEPTGLLKDAAQALVARVVPPPSAASRERTLRQALEHLASFGVTSVQDMGPDEETIRLCADLAAGCRLTARVRAVPGEVDLARSIEAGRVRPTATPWFRVSGAKGFADGSLGSGTACFHEPYADDPSSCGLLADEMLPLDQMRARLVAIDRAGEQLCIHGIGDRAISMVLDLFADVDCANGRRDRRFRIEHSQHVRVADVARYAHLGVIASVQPYHAVDDGQWAERRIGAHRLPTTFAFRTFRQHGVRLALGTDWPVAPIDPMQTIHAAVTRATLDGRHPNGWVPEQKLTVTEALEAYTAGSAYAEHAEHHKGTIGVGQLADLVLLSADPRQVPAAEIRHIVVLATVVGGSVVFSREPL